MVPSPPQSVGPSSPQCVRRQRLLARGTSHKSLIDRITRRLDRFLRTATARKIGLSGTADHARRPPGSLDIDSAFDYSPALPCAKIVYPIQGRCHASEGSLL